MTIQYDYI